MDKIEDWNLGAGFAIEPSYISEATKLSGYHPFDIGNKKFDVRILFTEGNDFIQCALQGDWPIKARDILESLKLKVSSNQTALHQNAYDPNLNQGFTRTSDAYVSADRVSSNTTEFYRIGGFLFRSLHIAPFKRDLDGEMVLLGRLIWEKVEKDERNSWVFSKVRDADGKISRSIAVTGWAYVWD